MSGKTVLIILGGLVVVLIVAALIFWPRPPENCPLPFLVDNGAKRASFEAKLESGIKVEGAAIALVNDPEIKNLLENRQNQAQLGEYLYCTALQRKEFQAGTVLAHWSNQRYHFLATGPSAEEMERWDEAHPRPGDERAEFSVSGLKQQQDHWSPIEWQGTLAWFSLSNVGRNAGQVVFRNLPRRDYMVLADQMVLEEDVIPVEPGRTRRIRLVQLFAGEAVAREFLMQAGPISYRILLRPPPSEQAARPQQAALAQFNRSLAVDAPANAGETYAAMLKAVNKENPAAGPAAPLLAGDLLASLGLGDAANLAYQKFGLQSTGSPSSPAIDYRLGRVRYIIGGRAPAPDISVPGEGRPVALKVENFNRYVLAVSESDFSGQLRQGVVALDSAGPSPAAAAVQAQLRGQMRFTTPAPARPGQ